MEQLRIGLPPRNETPPASRLMFGLIAALIGISALAIVLFIVLPLVGIIVSAAVGGMLLALAGVVMMIPFLLVAATVLMFFSRSSARRHASVRTQSVGH